MTAQVYFIRNELGPVKIGWAYDADKRCAALQAASPYELTLAATVEVDGRCAAFYLEARFFGLFHNLRLRGEWFAPCPQLDAVVRAIIAGTFDFDSLPPPWWMNRNPIEDWLAMRERWEQAKKKESRLTTSTALARSSLPTIGSQGQFHKIKTRQRDQDFEWAEAQRRRDADPLEQAKRFLRSRGYIVAPDEIQGFWACGRRRNLDAAELVALAERLGCPFERTIHEQTNGKPAPGGSGTARI